MWHLLIFLCSVKASDVGLSMYSNETIPFNSVRLRSDEDEIHFYLFTRRCPNRQELNINDTEQLLNSSLNFNETTKVIVHGWISNENTTAAMNYLKNSYILKTNFNIVMVDWSKLACTQYKIASSFVRTVSLFLIEFLKFLIVNTVSASKLHLIGHCLGAHITSFIGKYFRTQKLLIDAITALDPAYPLFKFKTQEELIEPTDARYVEVIHTNSETWGFRVPMGHVDFYPNGGKFQPGCMDDVRGLCAHNRAIQYYAESIISPIPFTAIYCETYEAVYYYINRQINMSGVHLNYGAEGMYYLLTHPTSPYVLGDPHSWNIFEDQNKRTFFK